MNATKGCFTADPQCTFSVFKGSKGELRFLSGGKISRWRSNVVSNQADAWKQTHGRGRVEWTLQVQIVLRNFLFFDTFHYKQTIVFIVLGEEKKKRWMMIIHRRKAAQELCCACVQLFSGSLGVMSLFVGVFWWCGTLQDVFLHFLKLGCIKLLETCIWTRGGERRKSEATCVSTLGHMLVRGHPQDPCELFHRIVSHSAPFESANKYKSRHVYLISPLAENGTVAANSQRQAANFSIIDFERCVVCLRQPPPPRPRHR